MTRIRCAAPMLALLGCAACASTPQGGGPVLTVAAAATGRYDSNALREPAARSAYGGGGEMLVRAANGVRAPTLQLEYAAGMRRSEPDDPGDGLGQRLNLLAGAPLSPAVRVDAVIRASRGGVDEDLAATNEVVAAGRMDLQLAGMTRLRGYGAHRWREVAGSASPALGRHGGVELRQRFGRSTTLLLDGRYEELEPPDASRSWERLGATLGIGQSVLPNTAVEVEVRGRRRMYPQRLVEAGDSLLPRRDEDLRYGVALVYDNGRGTELRLELERDSRRSNDTRRSYDADRISLVLRRRAFAIGGRREPPRIDERPGSDVIRAAFPDSTPATARVLSSLVVAGTNVCAIADAGAVCWPADPAQPRPVVLQGQWRHVSASAGRACGLDADGAVHCWSWNAGARTARGTSALTPPVRLRTELRFQRLAVGGGHACGLTADGRAWCWGDNGEGQLGNGLAVPSSAPVAVMGDLRFVSITAGERHTCGLDEAGVVHCWGANQSGQSRLGSQPRSLWPKALDGAVFTAVSAGLRHTCGLAADGTVLCWGDNGRGQAGVAGGGIADGNAAVRAEARFVAVAAGWAHTCALDDTGRAWCWGANRYGQLGTGGTDELPHPAPVTVSGGRTFTALSASFRTCALDGQQGVFCWGGTALSPAGDRDAARPRRLSTRLR